MSIGLTDIITQLVAAGITNPRLEARLMLAYVKHCEPAEIFADTTLNDEQTEQLKQIIARRLQHEPLDKIFGHREFFKADFLVNCNVLSPRPDTETLVECVLAYLKDTHAALQILDLGTGSGCIIESLLAEYKAANGVAVDASAEALQVAQNNAVRLGLKQRLNFVQADWFDSDFVAKIDNKQKFDVIVTNPPYIPTADIATLAPEVRDFDPRTALDGGQDGFDSYRQIAKIAPKLLKEGGYIFIEAGIEQADEIAAIFTIEKLQLVEIRADLAGIPRCVVLKK